ncbi:MAG: pantoate--beta-alanine ligase, partial [Ginsengibacter sp.]
YKWLISVIFFLTGGKVTIFFVYANVQLNVEPNYNGFMIIYKYIKDLKKYIRNNRYAGRSVGFVPTMGALHKGHLSLLKESKKRCQVTVASIFVNPIQFNNADDFKKYPKTTEQDILLLEENGCDVLFLPDEKEIYPNEESQQKHFDLGYLETILEGKFRPGHFQGVCLVVEKLLNIAEPDFLFMGQKDFQQCMVIKRLIEIMHVNIQLIICPILREASGLAMSSRNLRLNYHEIKLAAQLQEALASIKNNHIKQNFQTLKNKAVIELENKGFRVEYLELAKKDNLVLVTDFNEKEDLVLLIAAYLNEVRLIDNLLINH